MALRLAKDGRREWIGATVLLLSMVAASLAVIRPMGAAAAIAAPFGAIWLWVLYFFRDPQRTIPTGDNLFVSSADGVVSDITPIGADSELGCDGVRIGVFMNVFSVHVNRAPCDGIVTDIQYNRGSYLDVRKPDAWRLNESMLIAIDCNVGGQTHSIRVRQVAGLVARRIVCNVTEGDRLVRGERFGMIKFGSRLELMLPTAMGAAPQVRIGQKVAAGSTVLAAVEGATAEGESAHE